MLLRMEMVSPVEIVFLAGLVAFLLKSRRSVGFIVCASLFFVYAWAAIAVTIFPIRLDPEFLEEMRWNPRWADNINLRPIGFPGAPHLRAIQIYGNVCLGMPFGFGVPVVSKTTTRRVLSIGFSYAMGLELVQLAIGLILGFPYRVFDINDVGLVFAGVVIGYVALEGLARGCRMPMGRHS